jgi:hypothetical protein
MNTPDQREAWLEHWFKSMPRLWQEGLAAAFDGGAFEGELFDEQGRLSAVVYFVPPKAQRPIRRTLESHLPSNRPGEN